MVKIGCKSWSTNDFYVDIVQELFSKNVFDYIELFTVPGSAEQYLPLWEKLDIPYVLHAPHSYAGLNFSDSSKESSNRWMLETVKSFANALHPLYIIYHPGLNGTNQETIRQINLFKAELPSIFVNSCLENKPKMGIAQEVCVGFTSESVAEIAHATGMHTCFDFGHAVAAAASLKIDLYSFIPPFLALKPVIFHLSDGHVASEEDAHLNLGSGDYPLTDFINMLPENAMVSLETTKASKDNLDDFVRDVEFVRNVEHHQ